MNDTKLYEQILGLQAPWTVKSVTMKKGEGAIEIEVACAETLWGCPVCGQRMHKPDLDRLTFLEPEGKVGYRYGEKGAEQETMDYLEFIARVTSHIPDKGQVMVRYFGLCKALHKPYCAEFKIMLS